MGAAMKRITLLTTFLLVVGFLVGPNGVTAAQECDTLTVQRAAWKLGPYELAEKTRNVKVSSKCCTLVRSMAHNPRCLCTVVLSETARKVGVVPQIALDIVKRCGITNRPVGSRCGAYI